MNYNEFKLVYDESSIRKLQERTEQVLFERQEYTLLHNSSEWSEEIFFYIDRCDIDGLRERLNQGMLMTGVPGYYTSNQLRNMQDLGISFVLGICYHTIAERLIDSEISYSIADACIQMIESSTSVENVVNICCSSSFVFMYRIKEKQTGYHHLIRSAKEYIFQHLHDKINLKEMSEAIGTSQNYLSQLFHKSEGITLQQYILKERVSRAVNLLSFSDYTIQEISDYLNFSSSSHFGKVFKAEMHMTPSEYRARYALRKEF